MGCLSFQANGIDPDTAAAATGSYFNTFNNASKLGKPGLFTELYGHE